MVRFEQGDGAGGDALGLRIGGETPVGGNLYVASLASDEIAYVERYRLNALNRALADLREPVDAFFDEVMVMADDPALRQNRLALLKALRELFLQIADISLLAVQK